MKKYINYLYIVSSLLLITLSYGCDESSQMDTNDIKGSVVKPAVTSFYPSSGVAGTEVMITGENFSSVESVYVGNQQVKIKNRISNTQILIEITSNAVNGKIKVKNTKGESESNSNFTIKVNVPVIGNFTSAEAGKFTIGEIIKLEGENLKSVTNILVGDIAAKKIFTSDTEIKFTVPQLTPGISTTVKLQYLNGENTENIESNENFTILRPLTSPTVTSCPANALFGTSITLEGTNMDVVNHAIFAGNVINFTSQSESEIQLTIPRNFGVNTTGDLILVYNATEQMVAKKDFEVTVPVIANTINFYYGLTLGAEKTSASPAQHFFNPESGSMYSACQYEAIKANIYFFITSYSTGSTIQLNNPNNTATQTSRFACDGTSLTGEKLPTIVKFKKLNIGSSSEKVFYDKVISRTLEEINPSLISITAGTSTPRAGTDFNVGDVLLFQKFNGTTIVKVGFIEITGIDLNSASLGESTITFNCFFQK